MDEKTLDALNSPTQGGIRANEAGISLRVETYIIESMETI
jgi:hypothetical protein